MPRLRGRSLFSVCGDGQDAPPTGLGLCPVRDGGQVRNNPVTGDVSPTE